MEAYRTEEEQVEALKRWWDDNGRSTLIAIVVALAASLGWQGYRDYSLEQAEAASQVYDELIDALAPDERGGIDDTRKRTAEHLAGVLKTDYEGSTYSGFAALMLAKLRVDDGDLAAAEEELRWVLAKADNGEVGELAKIRLARVLAAQGEHQQGLDILGAVEGGSFPASRLRALGDIHLAMGNGDHANSAYQEALALEGAAGQGGRQSLLTMQIEQLNPVPARNPAPVESPQEQEVIE